MCVLECIAQHLPCNPISFVADERNEIARRALHIHTKFGTIPVALTGSEFFSQHAERALASSLVTTVEERNPCTASRPSVIACLASLMTFFSV